MCPPAPIDYSPMVAQHEVPVPRFEPVAMVVGLTAFLLVLAAGLAGYLVEFRIDRGVMQGLGYAALALFIVWFRVTKPSTKLTPTERSLRGKRRVTALLGFLTGVSVLGSILVATSLHTWQDWVRLAFTALTPISWGLLIHVRFTMGTGR